MTESAHASLVLETCPICRSSLSAAALSAPAPACPSCNADLRPYLELQSRSNALLKLAQEQIARGETRLAREVVEKLALLSSDHGPALRELRISLAIEDRDFATARSLLAAAEPAVQAHFEPLLSISAAAQRESRELYNTALSCARRGAYRQAAQLLEAAAQNDPDNPAIWQLRLKAELKQGAWQACLATLAALDRLGARPQQYIGLEALLPRQLA